jgi:hypothetical protein
MVKSTAGYLSKSRDVILRVREKNTNNDESEIYVKYTTNISISKYLNI